MHLPVGIPAFVFSLAATVAVCPSCSLSQPAPVRARFVAPATLEQLSEASFLDHPWPSDARREPDGTIRVAGLYNPAHNPIVASYVGVTKSLLRGFSPTAAAYLRFDGALDPASLPATPPGSLEVDAAVQLIDVDEASPERGQRKLVEWHWQASDGVYWQQNTLAVAPARGYPLRANTRYAIIVTNQVRGAGGAAVLPSDDLRRVLGLTGGSAASDAVAATFRPALAALDSLGIGRPTLVHLTAFTTGDPVGELFSIADDVRSLVPAPTVAAASWAAKEVRGRYDVYEGVYGPAPNYQSGDLSTGFDHEGGGFVFDAQGHAVLQSTFDMRFTLVVPNAYLCPPPAAGYPVVLYAHGTGGDYRSVVNEGHPVGDALAQQCLASMGVDQIFHGVRPGAPPPGTPRAVAEGIIELRFFNLNNPIAARTSGRQGAIDVVQQARLFTESKLSVPVNDGAGNPLSRTGKPIAFDPSRVLFFGHSQGGVNGPLFLAADPQSRGGVLSGTSGMITVALLEKTQPTPSVAGAVRALLGLSASDYDHELDAFHPVINLAQMLVDTTDPINYMPYIISHPRSGMLPKSIYQTEGIGDDGVGDSYAPPHGIEYASVAMGLPRQLPGVRPIDAASWSGIGDVAIGADGLSGNLGGGLASGVLAQFPPAPGSDGHFVVFDVPEARLQASVFCRNLAADPKGRVPAL
jgi:hypothetical protein